MSAGRRGLAGEPAGGSGAGLLCAGLVAVLLALLSRSLGNGWLFLLACLVAGVVVAAVGTRPRLGRLEVDVLSPPRVVVGGVLEQVLVVRNSSRRPAGAVTVTVSGPGLADGEVVVPALAAGGEARVVLTRAAVARGVSRRTSVRVRGVDAFGLLHAWRDLAVEAGVVVLPRPAPPLAVPAPPRGAGADVAGVRPWRDGDAASAVHGRASARRGDLVVLEREGERAPALVVVLGPGWAPGSVEAAEELLARVAGTVLAQRRRGRRVVLVVVAAAGGDLLVAEGAAVLDALAAVTIPSPGSGTGAGAAGGGGVWARRAAGADGQVVVAEHDASGRPRLRAVPARGRS